VHDPARFILIFGENAIVSGFGLALLGALEKALHLLMRLGSFGHARPLLPRLASSAPEAAETTASAPAVSSASAPASAYTPPFISQRSGGAGTGAGDIVTRGELNGRDYVLFRDGSVLIETLLGPRRFASISEAQEFIGAT
jgi:hypothetical protein